MRMCGKCNTYPSIEGERYCVPCAEDSLFQIADNLELERFPSKVTSSIPHHAIDTLESCKFWETRKNKLYHNLVSEYFV